MYKSRFAFALVFVSILLIAITPVAFGGQDKTDVCHITGTYDFGSGPVDIGHVITIADPAYQAHIDHGDPDTWTIVTLPTGEEVCAAQTEPPPPPPPPRNLTNSR